MPAREHAQFLEELKHFFVIHYVPSLTPAEIVCLVWLRHSISHCRPLPSVLHLNIRDLLIEVAANHEANKHNNIDNKADPREALRASCESACDRLRERAGALFLAYLNETS